MSKGVSCPTQIFPVEIWELIILQGDPLATRRLSCTSSDFHAFVQNLAQQYLAFALVARKECRIAEAKRWLKLAARLGNADAMFRLGHACKHGGWNVSCGYMLEKRNIRSLKWIGRAITMKHVTAAAVFYDYKNLNRNYWELKVYGHGQRPRPQIETDLKELAIKSNDLFAEFLLNRREKDTLLIRSIEEQHCEFALDYIPHPSKPFKWPAFKCILELAQQGCMRAQYLIAECYGYGLQKQTPDKNLSMHWACIAVAQQSRAQQSLFESRKNTPALAEF